MLKRSPPEKPPTAFNLYVEDVEQRDGQIYTASELVEKFEELDESEEEYYNEQAGYMQEEYQHELREYEEEVASVRKKIATRSRSNKPQTAFDLFVEDLEKNEGHSFTSSELEKRFEDLNESREYFFNEQAQHLQRQYDEEMRRSEKDSPPASLEASLFEQFQDKGGAENSLFGLSQIQSSGQPKGELRGAEASGQNQRENNEETKVDVAEDNKAVEKSRTSLFGNLKHERTTEEQEEENDWDEAQPQKTSHNKGHVQVDPEQLNQRVGDIGNSKDERRRGDASKNIAETGSNAAEEPVSRRQENLKEGGVEELDEIKNNFKQALEDFDEKIEDAEKVEQTDKNTKSEGVIPARVAVPDSTNNNQEDQEEEKKEQAVAQPQQAAMSFEAYDKLKYAEHVWNKTDSLNPEEELNLNRDDNLSFITSQLTSLTKKMGVSYLNLSEWVNSIKKDISESQLNGDNKSKLEQLCEKFIMDVHEVEHKEILEAEQKDLPVSIWLAVYYQEKMRNKLAEEERLMKLGAEKGQDINYLTRKSNILHHRVEKAKEDRVKANNLNAEDKSYLEKPLKEVKAAEEVIKREAEIAAKRKEDLLKENENLAKVISDNNKENELQKKKIEELDVTVLELNEEDFQREVEISEFREKALKFSDIAVKIEVVMQEFNEVKIEKDFHENVMQETSLRLDKINHILRDVTKDFTYTTDQTKQLNQFYHDQKLILKDHRQELKLNINELTLENANLSEKLSKVIREDRAFNRLIETSSTLEERRVQLDNKAETYRQWRMILNNKGSYKGQAQEETKEVELMIRTSGLDDIVNETISLGQQYRELKSNFHNEEMGWIVESRKEQEKINRLKQQSLEIEWRLGKKSNRWIVEFGIWYGIAILLGVLFIGLKKLPLNVLQSIIDL